MKQTYNNYFEKKYNQKRRLQVLAIIAMLAITVIVFALGFKRDYERQARLVQEGEQYYSQSVEKNKE